MGFSSLVLSLLVTGMPAADLDTILTNCEKDIESKIQAGTINSMETWIAQLDTHAKLIEYTTLDRAAATTVADHVVANAPTARRGLYARFGTFKPTGDVDAVELATLRLQVKNPDAAAETPASDVVTILKMPKSREYLASAAGMRLLQLSSTAGGSDAALGEMYNMIFASISDAMPVENLAFLGQGWGTYAEKFGGSPSFEGNWKRVHDAITAAAAKLDSAANSRTKSMLNRVKARMESNAGRGKLINHAAPAIDFLWNSDGKAKTLADYRGKVVVLDFWATWCGPCIASMPKLRELTDHYKGKDVVVLAVTSVQGIFVENGKRTDTEGKPDEEIAMFPGYIERQKINWTVAVSKQEVFNPDFGVEGIPYMAILDKQGRVRHAGLHPGALSLTQKQALIDPLLAE